MVYQLPDFLAQLPDPRRGQGQRHKLADVLTIVLMAILSGHQGLRGFARFASSNKEELTRLLALKHGVPCFFTFRAVLWGLNQDLLAQKFAAWVQGYHPAVQDGFVALDGKAVQASSQGGQSALQNFVAVVSAFGHQSKLVYGMQAYQNGQSGEAEALRTLVQQLGLADRVLTMDALHAQKKH